MIRGEHRILPRGRTQFNGEGAKSHLEKQKIVFTLPAGCSPPPHLVYAPDSDLIVFICFLHILGTLLH